MRFEQYIFTMCKKEGSESIAYKMYSKSAGLTDAECTEIHDAVQYKSPVQFWDMDYKEMMELRTMGKTVIRREDRQTDEVKETKIKEACPFSFSYFHLKNGKSCVALASPLGGYIEPERERRKGNYLLHALVFEPGALCVYPVGLYWANCFKTDLSLEELNMPRPVPLLPVLEIPEDSTEIDEKLMDFLSGKEGYAAYFFSAAMQAKERGISLFINDKEENLVYWMAALQMLMPIKLSHLITFNTYAYDYKNYSGAVTKKDVLCVGIRTDAVPFDYRMQSKNPTMIVMDVVNNVKSEEISISSYAAAMAKSYMEDMDEIYEFRDFLLETNIDSFTGILDDAYAVYEFYSSHFEEHREQLISMFAFADQHCNPQYNEQAALDFIKSGQPMDMDIEQLKAAIEYIVKYAGYMERNICELTERYFYLAVSESGNRQDLKWLFCGCGGHPEIYACFLDYMREPQQLDRLQKGSESMSSDRQMLVLEFLFKSYLQDKGLNEETAPAAALVCGLFQNMISSSGAQKFPEILKLAENKNPLSADIVRYFCRNANGQSLIALVHPVADWMRAQDPKTQECLIRQFESDVQMEGFLYEMRIVLVQESEKPENTFWSIYKRYYYGSKRDVSKLAEACFDRTPTLETVRDFLRMLEAGQYRSVSLVRKLISCLENASLRELSQMEGVCYETLYEQARELNCVESMQKTRLLSWGEILRKKGDSIYSVTGNAVVQLNVFEKREQKEYLMKYLPCFMARVQTREELAYLFLVLCDVNNPTIYVDCFVAFCESQGCIKLLADASSICIDHILEPRVEEAVLPVLRKEICRLDEQVLEKVKSSVRQERGEYAMDFFMKTSGGGTFMKKLNGLLGKKG